MLMPMILLSKEDSSSSDNTDILMLMMLQNPGSGQDPNMILPYLLLKGEDGTTKTDKKSLFLAMTMMNRGNSCGKLHGNSHVGEEIMTHMLMENSGGKDDLIMTMLMMQAMGGNQGALFTPNSLIPHLLVDKVKLREFQKIY